MLTQANGEHCGDTHHEPWTLFEGVDTVEITMGLLAEEHAEDCGREDCDCERDTFSSTSCEGCGSKLAGERHAFTMWDRTRTIVG
jgi:hypothetical protein